MHEPRSSTQSRHVSEPRLRWLHAPRKLALMCVTVTTAFGYPAVAQAQGETFPGTVTGPSTPGAGPTWGALASDFGVFALPAAALWGAGLTMETNRSGKSNTPHTLDLDANRVSDWALGGGMVITIAGAWVLDAQRLGGFASPESYHAAVVALEAMAISSGLNQVLKRSAGRCRPIAYRAGDTPGTGTCDPSAVPSSVDSDPDAAYLSWPSGHVNFIASATGAFLGLASKATYYGDPVWQYWLASGVGAVATGAVIGLRVKTGAHSWEDTLGSAALSVPVGMAVAFLHPLVTSTGTDEEAARLDLMVAGNTLQLRGAF